MTRHELRAVLAGDGYDAVRARAGGVRRAGRRRPGHDPRDGAAGARARGGVDGGALRALPALPRLRALLSRRGRRARSRPPGAAPAQPGALAPRDRRGRADSRARVLSAGDRAVTQPSRAGADRARALRRRRDEPDPDGAGRRLRGRAGAGGGAGGQPVLEQAAARAPGGAAPRLPAAAAGVRYNPRGRRTMAGETFDRTLEDLGNIVHLEHVNVRVPDQQLATQFYIVALGGTRDPYLMVGLDNMWCNFGHSQFHLPTAAPQVLRGVTGLVVPDFDELPARLAAAADRLKGTKFSYKVEGDHADVTCPWGNRLRLHRPSARFPRMELGMPYVEFPVREGTAAGIGRFYREIMAAPATVTTNGSVAAE